MGHKANKDFFNAKLPWSKRKDLILSHYLTPYLAKVAKLGRPVFLIDGFAGRGQFRDGSPGSPLLIAKVAEEAIQRGCTIQQLCIEPEPSLFAELEHYTRPFPFIECQKKRFLEVVPHIERCAPSMTVFLYLDPYTVEGLEWSAVDSILRHIRSSSASIELLLNFNAHSFARRARAAMKIAQPQLDESTGDADSLDAADIESTSIEKLDQIVGGDWWRDLVLQELAFPNEVEAITSSFAERLRERFTEVYDNPIKAHWRHTVPKYSLLFGSRSSDATRLMNDAIVKSRRLWADETAHKDELLFETRPTEVVPNIDLLTGIVTSAATRRMSRGDLIIRSFEVDLVCIQRHRFVKQSRI